MIRNKITIAKTSKMDATPAALLVQTASKYDARVYVEQTDKLINAKSIMGVMTLRIIDGEVVTIVADGADEEAASKEVQNLLTGTK
ncbi:MAG: HPr family phosphocarrier protein [Lachnospiraceae bacterium]|jgi:phosphotransferase system HPr (HPr) family protein|nr:HPr family phosphocarrier protein [Lachnospiraceae bacterium]